MGMSALTRAQFQDLFDVFVGDATVNPATVAANVLVATNVTVTGVALGDIVLAGPGVDLSTVNWSAHVSAANTVTVVIDNASADHIDIGSSTWTFVVLRPKAKITSF